jgi:hypothetical protein
MRFSLRSLFVVVLIAACCFAAARAFPALYPAFATAAVCYSIAAALLGLAHVTAKHEMDVSTAMLVLLGGFALVIAAAVSAAIVGVILLFWPSS